MTTPASLDLIKQFLQSEDSDSKTSCFRYLHHLLDRTFDKKSKSSLQYNSLSSAVTPRELKDNELQELEDAIENSQANLLSFLMMIVSEVVSFDLRLI